MKALIPTFILLGGLSAHAAVITWSSATNATSATDVLTTGTLVQAVNYGVTTSYVINGVNFVGSTTGVFGGSGFDNVFTGYGQPAGITGTNYGLALSTGNYQNGGGVFSGTLSGLTIGQQYAFQVWINDQRDATVDTMTWDSGTGTPTGVITTSNTGLAQYTTGTFVADAATQSIRITPAGGGGATVNIFQLRAVPEPATYGLIGAGSLAGLAMLRRRRKA